MPLKHAKDLCCQNVVFFCVMQQRNNITKLQFNHKNFVNTVRGPTTRVIFFTSNNTVGCYPHCLYLIEPAYVQPWDVALHYLIQEINDGRIYPHTLTPTRGRRVNHVAVLSHVYRSFGNPGTIVTPRITVTVFDYRR